VADGEAVHVGGAAELVADLVGGAGLPGDPGGVDRVDQRGHVVVGGGLAGELQAVVEVAVDREDPGPVRHGLRELAQRDLALWHENGAGQARAGGVGGGRRRRVAGGRAQHALLAAGQRVGDRHRHAAVLERARRVGPVDLEQHLAPGALGQVRGGQQRRATLTERDDPPAVLHRHAAPVGVDHTGPGRDASGGHPATPFRPSSSTRSTLSTPFTISNRASSLTVAASADSGATWVTTTRRAPVPSPLVCRTAAMLTPCAANAPEIVASTPARSATSRLTW